MNTEKQKIDSMISYLKINKINSYKLIWSNGSIDIIMGCSAENAFKNAGYGETDLDNLKRYETL